MFWRDFGQFALPGKHGSPPPFWKSGSGLSLTELLVVATIIVLALSVGFMSSRNAQTSATTMTTAIASQIALRQACDQLNERLFEGTEVVLPVSGMTLPFLVIKDVTNNLVLTTLEKAPEKAPGPYVCVRQTDRLTGTTDPKDREVLFDGAKNLRFTCLSPGLVIAHVTLANPAGKELAGLVEIPMKNIGCLDP